MIHKDPRLYPFRNDLADQHIIKEMTAQRPIQGEKNALIQQLPVCLRIKVKKAKGKLNVFLEKNF